MNLKLKPIGMRNIKTALAVFVCILISKILKLEFSFYVGIAAVITMQNSVSGTFAAAQSRMTGTLVGAFTGILCASVAPANPLLCGVGIVMLIYICNILNKNDSISIAGIVFLAIMVNLKGNTPLFYAIHRISDTFIGIAVAALINYFVVPPQILNRLEERSNSIEDRARVLVKKAFFSPKDMDFTAFNKDISSLKKHISVLEKESKLRKSELQDIERSKNILKLCNNIYVHLNVVKLMETSFLFNGDGAKADIDVDINAGPDADLKADIDVNTNVDSDTEAKVDFDKYVDLLGLEKLPINLSQEASEENIIYNYHMSKVLEFLGELYDINSKDNTNIT